LAAIPLLFAGLVACGSTPPLKADTVAASAEDALEKQIGTRPSITCPDDVEAKIGQKARCTLTAGDDPTKYGVTVTVTSVEGKKAAFDVKVDEQPQG
jgi:hypothetical protein